MPLTGPTPPTACPRCGTPTRPGQTVCQVCGTTLVTSAAPPRFQYRGRTRLLIFAGMVLIALIWGTASRLLAPAPTPPSPALSAAGDAFLTAAHAGDWATAFGLCAPSLQAIVHDGPGLEASMAGAQPVTWVWTGDTPAGDHEDLTGQATFRNGSRGSARLAMSQVAGHWMVAGIHMRPDTP